MTNLDLFSLTPLLSFSCLPSERTGSSPSGDEFQILSWTAGGRYDGREFVVVGCRANSNQGSTIPQQHQHQQHQQHQQYLIIRSIHTHHHSQDYEKSSKTVRDLNQTTHNNDSVHHLYGDIYHIDEDMLSADEYSWHKESGSTNTTTMAHPGYVSIAETGSDSSDQDIHLLKKHIRQKKAREKEKEEEESLDIESVSSVGDKHNQSLDEHIKNNPSKIGTQITTDALNSRNNKEVVDEIPVLRIVPWLKNVTKGDLWLDKTIIGLDFNPSGAWLSVICKDCSVYLLPLRCLLEIPTDQIEMSMTNLQHEGNDNSTVYFSQEFSRGGILTPDYDIGAKEKVMRRKDALKIGVGSLSHLVLHRGKPNKPHEQPNKSSWLDSLSLFPTITEPKTHKMKSWMIRRGVDISEMLEDSVCGNNSECFGPQNDLTIVSVGVAKAKETEKSINAMCACWWKTRSGADIVIIGTNDGRLCFVDVRTHKKTWIEIAESRFIINKLELVIDIRSSSILVRCYDPLLLFKQTQNKNRKNKNTFEMGREIHYEYFMLLLERPTKKKSNKDPYEGLNGITPEILAQSGFVLKNSDEEIDPATITDWDCIVQCYDSDKHAFSPQSLDLGDVNSHVQLSVCHNTGSVIADPHQHTPTPSEAAAAKLGLRYPKRRIMAQNEIEYRHIQQQNEHNSDPNLTIQSDMNHNKDSIFTEHARSCVHFGVVDMDQSRLSLHAIDEIYQPPRAHFKIKPSLGNVFMHNFIVSLAPGGELNQISVIAPPLASLMNPMLEEELVEEDMLDQHSEAAEREIDQTQRKEPGQQPEKPANDEVLYFEEKNSNESESSDRDSMDANARDSPPPKQKNDHPSERQWGPSNTNRKHQKSADIMADLNDGVVQILHLEEGEEALAILDRTTSVIMGNTRLLNRLDPLALNQLNLDAKNLFDISITPLVANNFESYNVTHSTWSSLHSPYLLLLTNKAVYQIEKRFDGFQTILRAIENQAIQQNKHCMGRGGANPSRKHRYDCSAILIKGLSQCCEVSSETVYEIAADRILADKTSGLKTHSGNAERAFELYGQSSVSVAKMVRQFLRPEWLHDSKHELLLNKVMEVLKKLLTAGDIPSRVMLCDMMFNILLLEFTKHKSFFILQFLCHFAPHLKHYMDALFVEMSQTTKQKYKGEQKNQKKRNSNNKELSKKEQPKKELELTQPNLSKLQELANSPRSEKEEQEERKRRLMHFVAMNPECSLKNIIRKLLNTSQQHMALHVLRSHDQPSSAAEEVQYAPLPVYGNLTDFFLSMIGTLGLDMQDDSAAFIIAHYPLLFLERKIDLECIPSKYWSDVICNMLDLVVQLCTNHKKAQHFHKKQQSFRKREKELYESYMHEKKYDNEQHHDRDNKRSTGRLNQRQTETSESYPSIAMDEYGDEYGPDQDNTGNASGSEAHADEYMGTTQTFPVRHETMTSVPRAYANKLHSYQEEVRLRQKQVVAYLCDKLTLFSLDQLMTIHSFLRKLTDQILDNLTNAFPEEKNTKRETKSLKSSNSDTFYERMRLSSVNTSEEQSHSTLLWSTPWWLSLHLKILLRIRQMLRTTNSNKNDLELLGATSSSININTHANDQSNTNTVATEECKYFFDRILHKFTGMLDVPYILDEIYRNNDYVMACALHDKLHNYHDYILTLLRYIYSAHRQEFATKTEFRQAILYDFVLNKLLLLTPLNFYMSQINNHKTLYSLEELKYYISNNTTNSLSGKISESGLSIGQGRCLTQLLVLWTILQCPIHEIERLFTEYFDYVKFGLIDALFKNWTKYQSVLTNEQMPSFSPKLMFKLTHFSMQCNI